MRYGKLFICFLTAAFLSVAAFFGTREYAWDGTVGITVEVTAQGETETIRCWESGWGDYFVFLPSYADLSQVRVRTNTQRPVHLDDLLVLDGMTCEDILMEKQYNLCFNGNRNYNLTFLYSANVASIYIDTASGNMEHIHEAKGNEEAGTIRIYTAEGDLNYAGNLESIKGRGNSTWIRDKKPYSVKLYTQADLLGMGQAQNWILLANYYDTTEFRNKMAYDLAEAAGMAFTPDTEWADLYLNGEYAGLYMLSERQEVHPQRVDIGKEGSFLISIEPQERLEEQGYPLVVTEFGTAFRVYYAGMDLEEVRQTLQSVENAILAEDGIDPVTGKSWTELIDVDSWVKKYLLEEVLGNHDAGAASQYFYFDGNDPSGKLHAGPPWDYDLILGVMGWQTVDPQAFLLNRPHIMNDTDAPWFYSLCQKEFFWTQVEEVYQTTFRPLLKDLLADGMDRYAQTVQSAFISDSWRWGMSDLEENVETVRNYLEKRVAFFDSLWIDHTEYCTVQVRLERNHRVSFAVLPGKSLFHLPEYDETAYLGWYRVDTEEPFAVTQPIYEDMTIYLKPVLSE